MADAPTPANRFLSKNRWRNKMFANDELAPKKPDEADVDDFLKPSTEKAQAQKQAAAAAFLDGAKPRIDVAKAQRWPGASEAAGADGGRSSGTGGFSKGRRRGLSVNFARTQPAIIGHGGDECEEPVIEVSTRRASHSVAREDFAKSQAHHVHHVHHDDMGLGTQTFNAAGSANREAERRGIVTRTLTSPGELSPPLQRKMELGHITAHATPPPPPERRLGPMGLGERPQRLQRTPTGFDTGPDDPGPRPSLESTMSYESDNPPPLRPLPAAPLPRLPELSPRDDESLPLDIFKHNMRADEGRALHAAASRRAAEDQDHSSVTSLESAPLQPASPSRLSGSAGTDNDPYRSRAARNLSPVRKPMSPDMLPLNTNPRPPSSSRASPSRPADRYSTTRRSLQASFPPSPTRPAFPSSDAAPFSAVGKVSILPTPSEYERPEHRFDNPDMQPPGPPVQLHTQQAAQQAAPPARGIDKQIMPTHRKEPKAAMPLGRSDTRVQGDFAFSDFSDRVQHMKGIFVLTAQLAGQLYDHTPMQWLRVASWWFLRGRVGMEYIIRNKPKEGEPQPDRLTQPHVDLAKAWWILTEIVKEHPHLRRYDGHSIESKARAAQEAGDIASAEVYEVAGGVLSSLKMLLGSMKRHQSMPPTQALIQGQDQSVWIEYPKFTPDANGILAGAVSKQILANDSGPHKINPGVLMPIGDTRTDFCYFRMFVNVSLSTDDSNTDRVPLPAIISVLRSRDDYKVKLSICSQTELVNIVVGSDPDVGPTWRDVAWKSKTRGMVIQLRHGFSLNVELTEQDFRGLWSIVDHTNRTESNLRQRSDERLALRLSLRDFSYKDSANPTAFPPDRVKGCKLMVFQKFELSSDGTGRRKLHRGYRLVVVTNTKTRTLSCVTHEMGTNQEPMNFEYATDANDNAPGLLLRFKGETPDKKPKHSIMSLFFNDPNERNHLFGTFTSMNQEEHEAMFAKVPLKAFSIENADPAEGFTHSGNAVLRKLQWIEAKTLNQDPEAAGLEAAPTIMSESLRIVCRHTAGIISDRMNLGPGELLVRLPVDGANELTLLRNPQHDMAVAIDASRTENGVPDELAELLTTLTTASTIRKLTFNSPEDLYTFQLAVTGFKVLFDGIASSLSISRRRMVVPIYKQWTASTIRIQVVQQDNVIQLLAFFEEFSHADAMNFQLKIMDVFEKTDKGGKACVKLVDAKFALPVEERRGEGKMGKEEGRISGWAGIKRRFVCLDQIEYPGEHDDILIAFDDATTRDYFAESLPATAKVGRKFTVRRKI